MKMVKSLQVCFVSTSDLVCIYIYIYVIIKYVSLILSFLGVFERLLHSFKSFTCSTQTRAGDTVRVRHTIRGH